MYTRSIGVFLALIFFGLSVSAEAQAPATRPTTDSRETAEGAGAFTDAQALFYNGHYGDAAAAALTLLGSSPDDLALYELRTSALLFQIKRAIGNASDKDKALKQCAGCADWLGAFQRETGEGVKRARAALKRNPVDDSAQFFLGKLDLNFVWLHLGTLGHKTGWNEYWEARHSLDDVLKRNPSHTRARLARAWIDYIVDTRMTWGTRWVLGGGNKKKALAVMRELAGTEDDFYTNAEARFALWDVQVRERNFAAAVATARELAADFPNNAELTRFIATQPIVKPR